MLGLRFDLQLQLNRFYKKIITYIKHLFSNLREAFSKVQLFNVNTIFIKIRKVNTIINNTYFFNGKSVLGLRFDLLQRQLQLNIFFILFMVELFLFVWKLRFFLAPHPLSIILQLLLSLVFFFALCYLNFHLSV